MWNFLNTVEAKVVILTWYAKPNETVAINKFKGQGHHTMSLMCNFFASLEPEHLVINSSNLFWILITWLLS